jgi:hypothetical protein
MFWPVPQRPAQRCTTWIATTYLALSRRLAYTPPVAVIGPLP